MKKKRTDYSRLRYEQELAAKQRKAKKEGHPAGGQSAKGQEQESSRFFFLRGILLPNLSNILLNNLLFLLLCLPVIALFELTLVTGAVIFLAGAWLFTAILASGMSALYHRAFEYTRKVAVSVRISFFTFFAKNFKVAAGTGLFLGFLWLICGIYLFGGNGQDLTTTLIYYFVVLVLLFLVSCYTVMVMAQVSQFDLPIKAILKNAVLLIPSCGWRGALLALLQMAYVLLLFSNLWLGLLLFFLGIPNLIILLAAHMLWPRLSKLLLKES